MVRAPCCEKMGLKRGPWTQQEDAILVSYIQRHGHGNWRALPKLAGLLRCGKSCRLRWTNYLRPDIKRGNFSNDEEEMIISLHEILGNRWSAIASRLPGRTDNEIKNVWHTHLKKRLTTTQEPKKPKTKPKTEVGSEPKPTVVMQTDSDIAHSSSDNCSSDVSCSGTDSLSNSSNLTNESMDFTSQELTEIDDSFWNDVFSIENCDDAPLIMNASGCNTQQWSMESLSNDEDVDYWLRIFKEAGELPEL